MSRGNVAFSTSRERIDRYRAALKAAGIAFDETLVARPADRTEAAAAERVAQQAGTPHRDCGGQQYRPDRSNACAA
jgi:DNA-binding LacI/PurR family transcriptional regulator